MTHELVDVAHAALDIAPKAACLLALLFGLPAFDWWNQRRIQRNETRRAFTGARFSRAATPAYTREQLERSYRSASSPLGETRSDAACAPVAGKASSSRSTRLT